MNRYAEQVLQPGQRVGGNIEKVLTPRGMVIERPEARHPETDAWVTTLAAISDVSISRLLYATVVKRAIDILACALLLAVLSPLLAIVLIAVKMDSYGPAMFVQDRVGRGGKAFRLYKFRTMTFQPSSELTWMVDENGQRCHKMKNDPRITRVGRLLRRTSIDELPQLLNILKGDMSLIGPRPELVEIVEEKYQDWQHERHIVRPGLTGWWQVSGRSNRPMHENTELDLFYVRSQSLKLDFLIALKTIRVVFKGLGAF